MKKYFGEGVVASSWTTNGQNFEISINREHRLCFPSIDPLRRRVLFLKEQAADGETHPRLLAERVEYPEDEIEFESADAAWACIAEIGKAVQYVQSLNLDPSWRDVPADLFDVQAPASVRD